MARPGRDSDDDTVELDMPEEDQRASSADGVGEERSGLMPGNLTQRVTSKRVLIWAAVCGSLLIALAIGFGVGFGTPSSPKESWPECVGWTPDACKALIESERPKLKVWPVGYGAMVTADVDYQRVRIWYNESTGLVEATPGLG
eukprot:jgi/Tetstr1/442605/TSEL_030701.t1